MSAAVAKHRRSWALGATAVIAPLAGLAAGVLAQQLGRGPTALLVVVGVVCAVAVGQYTSWLVALAAAFFGCIELVLLAALALPHLDVDLATGNALALVLVGLAGTVSLALTAQKRDRLRLPGRCSVALGVATALPSAVMLGWYTIIHATSNVPKLAWLMHNDAVWNMASTRVFLADGGFDPGAHANVAPGTYVAMSLFVAPGRGSVEPANLLEHDVASVAVGLLVLTAVASIMFGLVAASFLPSRFGVSRAVLALGTAVIPWTWIVFGLAVRYGFWNSIILASLLPALWLVWTAAQTCPRLASALTVSAGTILLAVWSPLVLVPAFLGVGIVVRHWRTHLQLRGLRLCAWLMPLVVMLVWFVTIVAPAAEASSGGLGHDGAFFVFTMAGAITCLTVVFAVTLVVVAVTGRSWNALGAVLIVGAGALGMALLLIQRRDTESGLWGYYPAKFSWQVVVLAVPVAIGLLASLMTAFEGGRWRRGALAVGALAASAGLITNVPPADLRVPTSDWPELHTSPDWRWPSVLPMVSMARTEGMSNYDVAAQLLFGESTPGSGRIYVRYLDDVMLEDWTRFWVLQMDAKSADDLLRVHAYLGLADTRGVCLLLRDWKREVTLVTKDPNLSADLGTACPKRRDQVTVELH